MFKVEVLCTCNGLRIKAPVIMEMRMAGIVEDMWMNHMFKVRSYVATLEEKDIFVPVEEEDDAVAISIVYERWNGIGTKGKYRLVLNKMSHKCYEVRAR